MSREGKRRHVTEILLFLAVFFTMLVFFTVLHPIPIMDEDDVIYTVLSRKAIPIPSAWNPSRMMPEVLMPLCGNLAALFAAFGLGSFIDCQVFVLAVMLSLFIAAYISAFCRLLEKRFLAGSFRSVCLSILFLLLHFLIFRTDYSRNLYMFYAYDACCMFFYTMPALLCCTLVMKFMADPEQPVRLSGKTPFRSSLLLLTLYFAVFSNLFGSVLLAAYAVCRLLRDAQRWRKSGTDFRAFRKDDGVLFGIVLFWLLAVVLEALGGRAGGTRNAATAGRFAFFQKLGQAASVMFQTMGKTCLFFRLLTVFLMLCGLGAVLIRPDRDENKRLYGAIKAICPAGLLTILFLLFLSAAVSPDYMGRPEAVFPAVFVVFLILLLVGNHILRRVPAGDLTLPIAIVVTCTMINTRFLTFADSNPLFVDGHVAVAVENEIYDQVIRAAEEGETEVTVRVPRSWDPTANWPHNENIGNPIAQFFLKYGIIDHEINVKTEPSDAFNEEFHIYPRIPGTQ